MDALNSEVSLKGIGGEPPEPGPSPKVKFTVFGEEMIEKQVKRGGSAGRVYLPSDWIGKPVKIIRID